MGRALASIFDDAGDGLRVKLAGIYAMTIGANLAAWAWALVAFAGQPLLIGTALLAYGLGLRHAVDADHIAAIDNVTRKLMGDGRRPVAVGFFFSLGHSSVVVLASLGLAFAASAFAGAFAAFRGIGALAGTLVSAIFLFAIALMNLLILIRVVRAFRRVRAGGTYVEEDLDMLLAGRGLLARLLRPLLRMIRASWQMYPLGLLFGLGFDTASEIALLGLSAAQGSHGLAPWSIMVFPALFTAGMSLVDTTDGVLMLGAYGWALQRPLRKLAYNMAITALSVAVALLVGGVEAFGLIGAGFKGAFWNGIGALNANFGTLGYGIVALFAASWIVSVAAYRLRLRQGTEAP